LWVKKEEVEKRRRREEEEEKKRVEKKKTQKKIKKLWLTIKRREIKDPRPPSAVGVLDRVDVGSRRVDFYPRLVWSRPAPRLWGAKKRTKMSGEKKRKRKKHNIDDNKSPLLKYEIPNLEAFSGGNGNIHFQILWSKFLATTNGMDGIIWKYY